MKKLFSLVSLSAMSMALFAQTSGGPDTYGYIWRNDQDAQGPVYNWIEIKSIGVQINGLTDDNSAGSFDLGWNFHYYWGDFNKVTVGSNGWMYFGTTAANIAATFPTIPTSTAPNNVIAPMMCDLTFTQTNSQPVPGATAWYWTNYNDTFIVQYDSVPYWVNTPSGYDGRYTLQIILSGADSSVTFQYKLTQSGTNPYGMASEGLRVGIENGTGAIGLLVLNDVFPTANAAIKFYYPNPVTYQVYDATPAWNQNAENGGFFLSSPYAPPYSLTTNIANTGNQPLTTANFTGTIYDAGFSQVWTSGSSVSSLTAGDDTTVTYPSTFSTNTAGTYIYRSMITSTTPADMNSGNDLTDNEMVVVDTSQAIVSLAFTTATSAANGLNWQGGGAGSGGGVYFIPPFYPADVLSLDYFIAAGASGGFTAEIRDDDGPNGAPGTVLLNQQIASSTINAYNNVSFSPLTITSGGFYVGWYMFPDTTVALGLDDLIPLSYRNYEIIGGSWAPYRNNSTDDLMIKANIQGSNTVGTNNLPESIFAVSQNSPNPASAYTLINFTLPSSGEVQFAVKNMLGQNVSIINLGEQSGGTHTLSLSTSKYASGLYFYSIKFGSLEVTKKMVVSR